REDLSRRCVAHCGFHQPCGRRTGHVRHARGTQDSPKPALNSAEQLLERCASVSYHRLQHCLQHFPAYFRGARQEESSETFVAHAEPPSTSSSSSSNEFTTKSAPEITASRRTKPVNATNALTASRAARSVEPSPTMSDLPGSWSARTASRFPSWVARGDSRSKSR